MDTVKKENDTICRVCLCSNLKKCISLFDEYENKMIFDYINIIANVQIKQNDRLPDKICPACFLDLQTAVQFRRKCESSNDVLQSKLLNKLTKTDISKEAKEVVVKKEEPEEELGYLSEEQFLPTAELIDIEIKPDTITFTAELEDSHKGRVQCDDCGTFFKSKCKLRVHWKKIHLPNMLICQICKRVFKSFKAFHRHKADKRKSCITANKVRIEGEGRSRVFHCKECKYKSHRMKDLQTHLVIHSGDRPFQCDMCSSTYTQHSSLQAHKESAHKDYKTQITCHYCGKHVKGRMQAYRHLKSHTANQYQCDVCKKMLKTKKSLNEHMQRHTGVRSYTCEKCASAFFTCSELCNHKRMVHNKGKYWYKCDLCEYKSMRQDSLKKHKSKHTDNNLPCTVCGKFFENGQKLVLHQRQHFEEKKYQCPQCDVKFWRKDSVAKHVRSKHKCTKLANKRPNILLVKKESAVIANQNVGMIEIEISTANIV